MKTKHQPVLSAPVTRGGDQTQNNSIRRKWLPMALAGLFVSIVAQSPSVKAQCPQGWDISGEWGLRQSNQAVRNSLVLKKSGTNVTGRASYPTGVATIEGSVKGNISENDVRVEISWSNGRTGIYEGTVRPNGQIVGTGYEKKSPGTTVDWSSDRVMQCPEISFTASPREVLIPDGEKYGSTTLGWSAGSGPSTVEFLVKRNNDPVERAAFGQASHGSLALPVGPGTNVFTLISSAPRRSLASVTVKAKRSSSTSAPQTPEKPNKPISEVPAAPQDRGAKPPYILASPAVVPLPGRQSQGMTTLIWDGGKGHPYAEVWVSVNGADPTQVVEQGKGTRQVPVERGKTYHYTLTDSGEELGSVNVTVQALPF